MDDIKKLYRENEYGYVHQDPAAKLKEETVQYYKEEYGIRTDVHRSCINCQIRQIEKYKDSEGEGEFKVKCSFIPKGLPKGSATKIKEISKNSDIPYDRAKKLMLSTIDPVSWAELMFGFSDKSEEWCIRDYQKEQLRCTAKRAVIREGRRSGKTFAIGLKLVYLLYNHVVSKGFNSSGQEILEGPAIMIVTPYQAQLTNIFDEMEALIKRNPELAMQVETGTGDSLYVKTPMYKMELKNGASVKGFVSGLGVKQDGSGGGTMRGQSADIIYMDEMDMIPEDILDKVVTPILLTKPGVMLIATSTPIGKRGKFYQWCLEREDFKEDYYPSSVLPHWDDIKEELLKENTKEGFRAEYMAEFIEGSYGVFKPSWISAAKREYEYDMHGVFQKFGTTREDLSICIGIDWNKNAGTEFYIVAYSHTKGFWFALDAINVPASDYSAQRWMKEVIRLNYKWKPDYIYADEGYGHTIIEDLKLHSNRLRGKQDKTREDAQTILLGDRLVSFNFSKKIELADPLSGERTSKIGKYFLVENAIRVLESGEFFFPSSDKRLFKQLQNYVVVKRNPQNGKPVYGMDNKYIGDHRLDALLLALGGLSLEVSVYSNTKNGDFSIPGMIYRDDESEMGYVSPGEEAGKISQSLKNARVPSAFNVLKIMRGSGSEEEDFNIKQKYYGQGVWEYPETFERKNRGNSFKYEERSSILESIENKNNNFRPTSSPGRFAPGRKRKKRSWK